MQTERVVVSRRKALELYRAYKTHQHYQAPIDQAIQRTYQLIAQGRVVIKALESIRLAGADEKGLPRLAIANATFERCFLRMWNSGSAQMAKNRWPNSRDRTNVFSFPEDTFPRRKDTLEAEGVVPIVPVHLRPKRALGNYHVLWEAEWTRIVPRDPMLLRRIHGDLWLVVAAWDLTEVERAALATRLNG